MFVKWVGEKPPTRLTFCWFLVTFRDQKAKTSSGSPGSPAKPQNLDLRTIYQAFRMESLGDLGKKSGANEVGYLCIPLKNRMKNDGFV